MNEKREINQKAFISLNSKTFSQQAVKIISNEKHP